ncbi:MAG TPA: recombinase family protein [Amycolatopsis sp.]|nr:recombinase family protein [Amycolatopsis sp.]
MTSTLTRSDQAERLRSPTGTDDLAREYLRVSRDKSGEERSQEDQHEENADAAAEQGWTLGDPYRDTGSASEYAQKARGNFTQLVADLRADRFGAQFLIIWETSRLSREVTGWVEMIDLCAARGVRIHVTSEEHTYDPANGHDRHKLISAANDAQLESFKTSTRITRARAREKRRGEVHGMIPYGYRREYKQVEKRGKLVPKSVQLPHPDQAPVVRELFRRFLAGQSLRSITLDFDRRGIRSTRGKRFTQPTLRAMLARPVYAGLRGVNPEVPGQWDELVSTTDFYAVQAILSSRTRNTPRPGARNVRLLSTIARCAVCDGPMSGKPRHGRDMYSCQYGSHVAVPVADLDAYVTEAVLDYLASDGVAEELTAPPAADGELARVLADKARCAAELAELERDARAGLVSARMATVAEEGIRERLNAAEAAERDLTVPNPLRALFAPLAPGDPRVADTVRDLVEHNWDDAETPARREALRVLLTPGMLGRLEIVRSPTPRQPCDVEKRIKLRNNPA